MASEPETRPRAADRSVARGGGGGGWRRWGWWRSPGSGWGGGDSLAAAKEQAEAEAKKKDERQAEEKELDPRVERLVVQPGEPKSEAQAMKPGHWATGTQRMRAIYQDFVGEERDERRQSAGRAVSGRRARRWCSSRRGP